MHVEMRPLDSVVPYDRNPRVNDDAVEAVARSLSEFGWRQPIVVDGEGVIVVGHTRWKAARSLGWNEAPVHVALDLTPEQARAYRLADNQTATIAEWDMELLPQELRELQAGDFNMEVLGWSPEELDGLLAPPGAGEGLTDPDDTPEPPKVALTRPGDLWVLGEHRLLCGDSTGAADVGRLMNGKSAALCATDPPYCIDYVGERPDFVNGEGVRVGGGKDWSALYREVDIADPRGFYLAVFARVLGVLRARAPIYCWHAYKRTGMVSEVWGELGVLDHQQIVWAKPTPVFGRSYWHYQHEPCLMGWRRGEMPEHDGDYSVGTIWEIDFEGKLRQVGNEHPTQKPVEIFARPMRKHTRPGDVCYEPFSGSGSQLIAAEGLGRRCYAMELEPVFVDVAVRRWERFTGKVARRYGPDGAELPGLPAAEAGGDDDGRGGGGDLTTEKTPAERAGVGEG